jgi:hypothetical protein
MMKYYKNSQNEVFAFESDGSQDDLIPEGLSPVTQAEAEVLAAPESQTQNKTKFSSREFLKRLGSEKRIALKTHENMEVQLWYEELLAADFVDVDDEDTQSAVGLGVMLDIFTQAEADTLLAPEVISG